MTWKRNWFFRIEALQITAGERRVMMLLLVSAMIATGIARLAPSRSVYDLEYYEPVISEFRRLSQAREKEYMDMMARYYPPADYSILYDMLQQSRMHLSHSPLMRSGPVSDHPSENLSESIDKPDSMRVRIRTADQEDLIALPGIGPVTAERIIQYRNEYGPIRSIDDLRNVTGIGQVTIENIREYILID